MFSFRTDPITGQWRVIKGILTPRTLTNPDTGIISLVGKVQNVSQPVDDSVNGVPCWHIAGQLDAKNLAFFTGGGDHLVQCYRQLLFTLHDHDWGKDVYTRRR